MAAGVLGPNLVCYLSGAEAARVACAAKSDCVAVSAVNGYPAPDGSTIHAVDYFYGSTSSTRQMFLQSCEVLDSSFFATLFPIVVTAAVAILCARLVWKQFHAHA